MVVKTNRFCKPGETILGGEFFMFPGGKGGNQAVAAARLGAEVVLVSKLGNDIFGKNAIAGYEKEGIITSHIFTDAKQPSGVALITINGEGENTIVVASGANHSITEKDIDKTQELINRADIILLQLEIPLPIVEYVMGLAKAKHKKIILNPAPAQQLPDTIFEKLFAITPNETEAEILTGIKVTDAQSAGEAAGKLQQQGVEHVLITMGSKGVFVQTKGFTGLVQPPVVTAIDTTAAGDVFNGALAVALEKNQDWENAVRFACGAASISVTRMGAQSSAPYLSEMEA